jgi:hypothetical protein
MENRYEVQPGSFTRPNRVAPGGGRGWCRREDGRMQCGAERSKEFPAVWDGAPDAYFLIGKLSGVSPLLHIKSSTGAVAYLLSETMAAESGRPEGLTLGVRAYGRKPAGINGVGPCTEADGDFGAVLPETEWSREGLSSKDSRVRKVEVPGHCYVKVWTHGTPPEDAVIWVTTRPQ